MAFLAKGTRTYKVRVDHPDGRHGVLTTGCVTEEDARAVERVVKRWQGREGKRYERLDVIDALVSKRFPLPAAYDAHCAGFLDDLLRDHPPVAVSPDLLPLIDTFVDEKVRSGRGVGQGETYRKQLLKLFPERPFTLAMFNRSEVWKRLDALDVDSATRNRYRSAASWLAKGLVKHEKIDRNFVRDIDGYGENTPRLVYYEISDARSLIASMPQPFAAISALALGFCTEWGAISRARVGDLSIPAGVPVTCRIRGTKSECRDRVVRLVDELQWTLEYIKPALSGKLPGALIADGVPEWRAIREQRSAAAAARISAFGEEKFGPHSLHDWRHTHAVALLRWRYAEQIVSDHLGHTDTTLVRRVYGRYKPTARDYEKTTDFLGVAERA